jgi:hypothetical protein
VVWLHYLYKKGTGNVSNHLPLQFDFYLIGLLGPSMEKLIEKRIFGLIPF